MRERPRCALCFSNTIPVESWSRCWHIRRGFLGSPHGCLCIASFPGIQSGAHEAREGTQSTLHAVIRGFQGPQPVYCSSLPIRAEPVFVLWISSKVFSGIYDEAQGLSIGSISPAVEVARAFSAPAEE